MVEVAGEIMQRMPLEVATTIYVVHQDATNNVTVPWEVDGRSSDVENTGSGESTFVHYIQMTTVLKEMPVVTNKIQQTIMTL